MTKQNTYGIPCYLLASISSAWGEIAGGDRLCLPGLFDKSWFNYGNAGPVHFVTVESHENTVHAIIRGLDVNRLGLSVDRWTE